LPFISCFSCIELIHDDLIKSLQGKLAETQIQHKETETKLSDAIRKIEQFEKDKIFEREAREEKNSELSILQQKIQELSLQLKSKNEEATTKLSNAIEKIEKFENDIKKCEETVDDNLSILNGLKHRNQELELQLLSKDNDINIQVSAAEDCKNEIKVSQNRLISVEREKNEAIQARAEAERAVTSIVQSKDKVIENLESKLEETKKQEERYKDLYHRTQDDKRKVERTVSDLERLLRTRQLEAKKHYCNVTMLFDDIVKYSISSGKAVNRKVGPYLSPMRMKGKTFFTKAKSEVNRVYIKHILPFRMTLTASVSSFYQSHAKIHVEKHILPLYEKHLASHVKKMSKLIGETRTSFYLFAVSCVKDTSRELLDIMEQKNKNVQPEGGLKNKKSYPDWLLNLLRFAVKNAEGLVQSSAKVFRWLVYLLIFRLFLSVLLRLLCLPLRTIRYITRKKKKGTARNGEFKKPHITMV
jgi:hypothetical protein